jgi:hypothetical protein
MIEQRWVIEVKVFVMESLDRTVEMEHRVDEHGLAVQDNGLLVITDLYKRQALYAPGTWSRVTTNPVLMDVVPKEDIGDAVTAMEQELANVKPPEEEEDDGQEEK